MVSSPAVDFFARGGLDAEVLGHGDDHFVDAVAQFGGEIEEGEACFASFDGGVSREWVRMGVLYGEVGRDLRILES